MLQMFYWINYFEITVRSTFIQKLLQLPYGKIIKVLNSKLLSEKEIINSLKCFLRFLHFDGV